MPAAVDRIKKRIMHASGCSSKKLPLRLRIITVPVAAGRFVSPCRRRPFDSCRDIAEDDLSIAIPAAALDLTAARLVACRS
jgi:hypothetical protein